MVQVDDVLEGLDTGAKAKFIHTVMCAALSERCFLWTCVVLFLCSLWGFIHFYLNPRKMDISSADYYPSQETKRRKSKLPWRLRILEFLQERWKHGREDEDGVDSGDDLAPAWMTPRHHMSRYLAGDNSDQTVHRRGFKKDDQD